MARVKLHFKSLMQLLLHTQELLIQSGNIVFIHTIISELDRQIIINRIGCFLCKSQKVETILYPRATSARGYRSAGKLRTDFSMHIIDYYRLIY